MGGREGGREAEEREREAGHLFTHLASDHPFFFFVPGQVRTSLRTKSIQALLPSNSATSCSTRLPEHEEHAIT